MFWKFSKLQFENFKTSRVTINREMHEQVHTIFYLLYSQQNYSIALLCTPYVLQKTLQWVPKCSHVFFEPIKNVMLWQVKQAWSFWKFLWKYYKPNSKAKFQFILKVARVLKPTNLFSNVWYQSASGNNILTCRLWWTALPLNHVKCDLTVMKVVYSESMAASMFSPVHTLKRLQEKTTLVDQENCWRLLTVESC